MDLYIGLMRGQNDRFAEKTGRARSFYTHTFGCQQNVSDGEKINGLLLEMGYVPAQSAQQADVIIYNTCAVRENAEDRVFGNVGALKNQKAANPDMIIGLCGCMVQQPHIAEKIKKSFPFVDIVFGAGVMHLLPELLYNRISGSGRLFKLPDPTAEIVEDLPVSRDSGVKAWLPIMYGCDNFCTYCVVPLVRGRERSREPEKILTEARELIESGCKDITLLGQNVNSYGKTLKNPVSFSQLLHEICKIEGDYRIRFMTSHPRDCTRELIDIIAAEDKICNHLHLPVQSGSERILAAMNRHYTIDGYKELIAYARDKIPGIAFTSDIIVGFPSETREDFEETLKLVKDIGYQSLFTFIYSRREGTSAAQMPDPVPYEEKMRWFRELLDVQNKIGQAKYDSLVGSTLRVLAECHSKTGTGQLSGRSESGVIVEFTAPAQDIGQFVNVRVDRAANWALFGEKV